MQYLRTRLTTAAKTVMSRSNVADALTALETDVNKSFGFGEHPELPQAMNDSTADRVSFLICHSGSHLTSRAWIPGTANSGVA